MHRGCTLQLPNAGDPALQSKIGSEFPEQTVTVISAKN